MKKFGWVVFAALLLSCSPQKKDQKTETSKTEMAEKSYKQMNILLEDDIDGLAFLAAFDWVEEGSAKRVSRSQNRYALLVLVNDNLKEALKEITEAPEVLEASYLDIIDESISASTNSGNGAVHVSGGQNLHILFEEGLQPSAILKDVACVDLNSIKLISRAENLISCRYICEKDEIETYKTTLEQLEGVLEVKLR